MQALITFDVPLGQRATEELGLPTDAYDTLSLALTYRPARSSAGLGGRLTPEEMEKLKAKYANVTAADVNRFMQRLPRDLLFIMRSTNMIRSLNLDLGGTSRQRFRVMGECAVRGLTLTTALEDVRRESAAWEAAHVLERSG
ncbi:hypothetical protein EON67_10995, partial [archaeon]